MNPMRNGWNVEQTTIEHVGQSHVRGTEDPFADPRGRRRMVDIIVRAALGTKYLDRDRSR